MTGFAGRAVAFLLALSLATPAWARPVGYAGGWILNADTGDGGSNVEVMYTPAARVAVGVRAEHNRPLDHDFAGAALNLVVFRHNAPDSQANLYLTGAAGVATGRYVVPTALTGPLSIHAAHLAAINGLAPGPVLRFRRAAGSLGAQADWESRRFLVLAEARGMTIDTQGSTLMYRGRVGVAPYVAESGALHTWLILQAEHNDFAKRDITVTPLVRLFKGTTLVEVGSSLQGRLLATVWLYF